MVEAGAEDGGGEGFVEEARFDEAAAGAEAGLEVETVEADGAGVEVGLAAGRTMSTGADDDDEGADAAAGAEA